MLTFIDIETLSCADPAVIAEIAANVKPPKTLKKAESIVAWERDEKPAAIQEAIAKTSFDGLYGSICCIAYAFDDGEIHSVDVNSSCGEKAMLEHFYSHVYDKTGVSYHGGVAEKGATLVGHNIAGFDLPFLKHRSIILGVRPPAAILAAMKAKPWGNEIADTMLMWSADREKRVSLDRLCKAFGIKGKDGFDGSMVADTWPIDPQKVIEYCKDDVTRVRAVYKRLVWL